MKALVLGGAASVWTDVEASRELLGREWWDIVVAANDIGCHWPHRLDHWATLHPEKMAAWIGARATNGHPPAGRIWTRTGRAVPTGRYRVRIEASMIKSPPGGSSGLLAVWVAFDAGCDRLVLCGMPMDPSAHFKESTVHVKDRKWSSADSHWRAWTREGTLKELRGKVRSMSGRTREKLGAPTPEWLAGGKGAAA